MVSLVTLNLNGFCVCVQLENRVGGEQRYQQRVTQHLVPCVGQFAVAMGDDSQWKTLNYQILLKTRHSDTKVRPPAQLTGSPEPRATQRSRSSFTLTLSDLSQAELINGNTKSFKLDSVLVLVIDSAASSSSSTGAFLLSADAHGGGVQTEGELHGAAAGDHPLPG